MHNYVPTNTPFAPMHGNIEINCLSCMYSHKQAMHRAHLIDRHIHVSDAPQIKRFTVCQNLAVRRFKFKIVCAGFRDDFPKRTYSLYEMAECEMFVLTFLAPGAVNGLCWTGHTMRGPNAGIYIYRPIFRSQVVRFTVTQVSYGY